MYFGSYLIESCIFFLNSHSVYYYLFLIFSRIKFYADVLRLSTRLFHYIKELMNTKIINYLNDAWNDFLYVFIHKINNDLNMLDSVSIYILIFHSCYVSLISTYREHKVESLHCKNSNIKVALLIKQMVARNDK